MLNTGYKIFIMKMMGGRIVFIKVCINYFYVKKSNKEYLPIFTSWL